MNKEELLPLLESMIFISDKPVGLARFTETLAEQVSKEDIETALSELLQKYQQDHFGIELRLVQGGYQFCTKAKYAEIIRKFLSTKPFRLGRSTLETLAIIAYKQPVTRAEIDQIRGLDSSHLLRTLRERACSNGG
jgi:segregation and condensation protein B